LSEAADSLLAEYTASGDVRSVVDFTDHQKGLIRKRLDNDLYAFAIYIFGYRDLIPSLHGDLAGSTTRRSPPTIRCFATTEGS
jgi:hypothetical protein